jgi:hypothetical protein
MSTLSCTALSESFEIDQFEIQQVSRVIFQVGVETPNPMAAPVLVRLVQNRISGASSNAHGNSKRRASEGPLSDKAAQSTVLVYFQKRKRERVVYGDGEFGVDGE